MDVDGLCLASIKLLEIKKPGLMLCSFESNESRACRCVVCTSRERLGGAVRCTGGDANSYQTNPEQTEKQNNQVHGILEATQLLNLSICHARQLVTCLHLPRSSRCLWRSVVFFCVFVAGNKVGL